jgi:hypothetical protein
VKVDTLTTLKGLSGTNRFNGLALIVLSKKAWYVYDIGATEAADNDNIILPDDSVGRWYKCNNEANILNTASTQNTAGSTTTLDFSNLENLQLVFTQNTTINFVSSLRNGHGNLILNRNNGSFNITSWDVRVRFAGSSYNFSTSNIAILSLVFFNNVIYVTKISEYS